MLSGGTDFFLNLGVIIDICVYICLARLRLGVVFFLHFFQTSQISWPTAPPNVYLAVESVSWLTSPPNHNI